MSLTYQYNLDGAGFVNTASSGTSLSIPLSGLAVGYHTLQVRATDSTAGAGPVSTTVFQVTTTPPATPTLVSLVDSAGGDLTTSPSTTATGATITWTVPSGCTSLLYVDGTSQGTQTSPYTKSGLGIGAHSFRIYSVKSGVGSTTPLSKSWSVTNPVQLGPGSGTYSRAIPMPGTPGSSVPVTLYARATDTDLTSNTTTVSESITVNIPAGNNPPQCTITYPPNNATLSDTNVGVIVTAIDVDAGDSVASVQASIDNGVTWNSLTSIGGNGWQTTVVCPDQATTVLIVKATDTHGAVGTDSATFFVSTIPPPVPGPGPRPIPKDTAIWRVVLYDHQGNTLGSIQPDDLQFSLVLNQPGNIQFGLNLEDPAANIHNINPNLHDWGLFRNTTKLMAGFISSAGIDTDTRELTINGTTWEGYFTHVTMPFNPNALVTDGSRHLVSSSKVYTSMDLHDIVRDLVKYVIDQQSNTIGPMLYTTSKSGFVVSQNFDASQLSDLLTLVNDLSGQSQGFDWQVDPNKRLLLYSPQKGTNSPLVLDLLTNVKQIVYTDNGIRGNFVTATGSGSAGSSRAMVIQQNPNNQQINRLFNEVVDYGTVPSIAFLTKLATGELALAQQNQINMTVTCIPLIGQNVWDLADVGDWIRVRGNLEYVNLDSLFRCVQIDGNVDRDGNEEITYTFAPNTIG